MVRRWLVGNRGYRDLWLLLATGLALWAVVLTFSVSAQNHRSLCALRADLQRRVVSGQAFLHDHPRGAFGFSTAQIAKGVHDQERTIRALRFLNC